jgi:uncharacterized damage-inducible protein DinB
VWATLQVIDACGALSPEQMKTAAPGTYGAILDTLRHLVGADASYLFVTTGGRVSEIDTSDMQLSELRVEMDGHGAAWQALVSQDLDPDVMLARRRDDGTQRRAPLGIRLAQALHHGTDHRSRICTALTSLGVEPPLIDVWDFAGQAGRLEEIAATS